MYFSTVAALFAQIEQESSRTSITQLLAQVYAAASADEAQFLAYFCLGALYPPYYNKTMNIADKSALRAISVAVGVPLDEVARAVKECGDGGSYLLSVTASRENYEQLSVLQVKELLHKIVEVSGEGSQELRERLLADLLVRVSPLESCFIMRSVVGTLRLGFSDMTLLDAFSWMAAGSKSMKTDLEHCYNVSADLGRVIWLLKTGGSAAVAAASMVPGIPVRPAAADRLADSRQVFEKLGVCVAQPKLDGFRVQIHRWIDELGVTQHRFFSRNLHDMSAMFPDLVAALAVVSAESIIMEGEAIVHDAVTGSFVPFQETVKRKRKHGIDEAAADLPLTLYLFDVLFCNGESLLHKTHAQRRAVLGAIAPEQGIVRVIEEVYIESADQLSLYFEHAMSTGLEGIVVKKIDALYQPGKRSSNWVKLKRQERGELADTLDCVVLGYYRGAGRRAAFGIGAFLVGVYNPALELFETIAKIGTGLSDDEWQELRMLCDARVATHKPLHVVCAAALVPDVWVQPYIVCSVRADDITRSPVHAAGRTATTPGYALRFPRIMGYRPDKSATDATTIAEVAQLYTIQDLKHKK